jgi:hypothetical protein
MGMRNSVPQHLLGLHRAILRASEEQVHLKVKQDEYFKHRNFFPILYSDVVTSQTVCKLLDEQR